MNVEEWLGKDNKLGIDIWNNKYRYKNESFDEWLDRVSEDDEKLKQLIIEKKFLFGGRILANRGLDKLGKKVTYSNCYVVSPPEDSIEGIFDCGKKLARTFSYGGGCGIDIGKLRPRGMNVNNAAETTTGSVSFMDFYSMITGTICQQGRRGALMISIPCTHPDLEEFIDVKTDLNRVTKANISVRITDDFMKAVKENKPFKLHFKVDGKEEEISKTINARDFFKKLCNRNWNYAEPGILFWDRIEKWNLLVNTKGFKYAGVNPCAEESLPSGGSCLLGSMNLSEYVKNKKFDINSFCKDVRIATKALNNVLDEGMSLHPLKEQRESVRDWRQIGLGIFGLADMLIKLEVEYGSKESIEICKNIAQEMINNAIYESAELAKEKGTFPKYNKNNIWDTPFFKENTNFSTKEIVSKYGLRNSQLLCIAPTGSLSTMLGVSGGIEPIYANYYERKTESLKGHDEYYKVYTPIVKKYMEKHNLKDESELPSYFVTAQTLNYKKRIDMQSIWQHYIDASISSTVNLPHEATQEEVEGLYMYAWEKGLKGITIFRDGCKRAGILSSSSKDKENKETTEKEATKLSRGMIVNCSDDLVGRKRKLMTGCGSLHLQVWADPSNGNILELYLSKGSTGGCIAYMNGLSRMVSYALRGGCPIEGVIDQLESIPACPSFAIRTATKGDTSKGTSCPHAVAEALKEIQEELWEEYSDTIETPMLKKVSSKQNIIKKKEIKNPCPICGAELVFEGGCNTCKQCGYSKCE